MIGGRSVTLIATLALLISTVGVTAPAPACEDKVKASEGEIGIRDQNGVTLASRFATVQRAGEQMHIFTYRVCNGFREPVTVDWYSAALHVPPVSPGQEALYERTYSDRVFRLLTAPRPVDVGARVETAFGEYNIRNAPAYQTTWNALVVWTKGQRGDLLRNLIEAFIITRVRRSPEVIFESRVRPVAGGLEYTYSVRRSETGVPLYAQWISPAGAKVRPNGLVITLERLDVASTSVVRGGPPLVVNDLAFYSTEGREFIPGRGAELVAGGDITNRLRSFEPLRSQWKRSVFVLAPALVPSDLR